MLGNPAPFFSGFVAAAFRRASLFFLCHTTPRLRSSMGYNVPRQVTPPCHSVTIVALISIQQMISAPRNQQARAWRTSGAEARLRSLQRRLSDLVLVFTTQTTAILSAPERVQRAGILALGHDYPSGSRLTRVRSAAFSGRSGPL